MILWTANPSARCLQRSTADRTKQQFEQMRGLLCDRRVRIFSKAQVVAALIGAAVGAFLGVQAYYHGWLG